MQNDVFSKYIQNTKTHFEILKLLCFRLQFRFQPIASAFSELFKIFEIINFQSKDTYERTILHLKQEIFLYKIKKSECKYENFHGSNSALFKVYK